MTEADIRLALYVAFGLGCIEGVTWCARIGLQPDAPRVARPMAAMLFGLCVACIALGSAQSLQSWNMARYFDFVDYIRWGLIGGVGLALAAFYWWRLGWYYDAVKICIFGIEIIIRGCNRKAVRLNGRFSREQPRGFCPATKEGEDTMQLDLHDGKQVTYIPNPVDAEGNPTSIEPGSLQGSSSDTSLVTVERNPDGSETLIVSSVPGPGLGPVGISVTGDADRGAGVATLTESHTINVIAGDASSLGGSFSGETDRPAPEPTPEP